MSKANGAMMPEAPERIYAWQDPTGLWHTRFEAEPYEPAVKCKSPSTLYIRVDEFQRALALAEEWRRRYEALRVPPAQAENEKG